MLSWTCIAAEASSHLDRYFMLAKDLMTSPVVSVHPDATIGAAARLMLEWDVSALPVVDERDNLVGMLTHSDFGLHPRFRPIAHNVYSIMGATATPRHLEEVSRRVAGKYVRDVMRRTVFTVQQDATIAHMTELMLRYKIHRLPVMDGDRMVGIVTRHDFLKLIADKG